MSSSGFIKIRRSLIYALKNAELIFLMNYLETLYRYAQQNKELLQDEWFVVSFDDISNHTFLNKKTILLLREKLNDMHILEYKIENDKNYYRINFTNLANVLSETLKSNKDLNKLEIKEMEYQDPSLKNYQE